MPQSGCRSRLPLLLGLALLTRALCGCGNPGSPLPPSLLLPEPVGDLRAARVADTVTLSWTMPSRSTDGVALKGNQRVSVCRAAANGPCSPVPAPPLAPGQAAEYRDVLPANLRAGPLQALRYEVRVENRRGAAASGFASTLSASGVAPPPIRSASAEATAKGIAVRWDAEAEQPAGRAKLLARLTREQAGGAAAQTLEAAQHEGGEGWAPNHTLDTAAELKGSYRYHVVLVEEAALNGQPIEVAGKGAETPTVAARDVFPPAAPQGLEAAANPQGGTIDLSWNPGTEADLQGYFVYRREAGSAGAPERISGKAPVPAPGWSDAKARPGVRYAYSVSAIDTSGNESARSGEALETLPAPEAPRR